MHTFDIEGNENTDFETTLHASFKTCRPGFEKTTPNVKHNARQTTFRLSRINVSCSPPPLAIIVLILLNLPSEITCITCVSH